MVFCNIDVLTYYEFANNLNYNTLINACLLYITSFNLLSILKLGWMYAKFTKKQLYWFQTFSVGLISSMRIEPDLQTKHKIFKVGETLKLWY